MAKSKFSDKQIEIANLLKSATEGAVSPTLINEILSIVDKIERESSVSISQKDTQDIKAIIKMKLLSEKDWKKKAQLSAMLISLNLSE